MTPIEHRVLSAVKDVLSTDQRPSVARVALVVQLSEKQTRRYMQNFEAKGLLTKHGIYLWLLTGVGHAAVLRGPTQRSRGLGRTAGHSRPEYGLLYAYFWYPKLVTSELLRANRKAFLFVQIQPTLRALIAGEYLVETPAGLTCTEKAIRYLDEMRVLGHAWWQEEEAYRHALESK